MDLQELKSAIQNEATLDMHDLFHRFTLDSIGEIGFGVNVNSMENPNNPFANSFNEYDRAIHICLNNLSLSIYLSHSFFLYAQSSTSY